MSTLKQMIGCAAISLAALGPSAAWADCVQANFGGTYQAYIITGSSSGLDWASCKVAITDAGAASSTGCTLSIGATAPFGTGAKVKLSNGPTCVFAGTFTVAGNAGTASITLSDDHLTAVGVGKLSGKGLEIQLIRIQ